MMGLKTFRTIALGEFIPYEWLTTPLKEMLKSDEGAENTDEKSNVLANMGVMLRSFGTASFGSSCRATSRRLLVVSLPSH